MSKSKRTGTPYDHIRKPIPKPSFSFKSRKREIEEAELDGEMESYDEEYEQHLRKYRK